VEPSPFLTRVSEVLLCHGAVVLKKELTKRVSGEMASLPRERHHNSIRPGIQQVMPSLLPLRPSRDCNIEDTR
jgi:hypothetical protein